MNMLLNITSKVLVHLGIVGGVCKEIILLKNFVFVAWIFEYKTSWNVNKKVNKKEFMCRRF